MSALRVLVASRAMSQRLVKKGIILRTGLYWLDQVWTTGDIYHLEGHHGWRVESLDSKLTKEQIAAGFVPAPTAQELLDAIRAKYPGPTTEIQTFVSKTGKRCWGVLNSGIPTQGGTSDADALAKCLLKAMT